MKVIIIDDSLTIRLMAEAYMEDFGLEEEEIFSFEDANEALKFIKDTDKVEIIFTDMYMPKMDGFEFVEKLLAISKEYTSKLYIMSGEEDYAKYREMKILGATKFIKKPFTKERFGHTIRPVIAKIRKIELSLM
jgi:DNA-binding NtrC family response regulator